MPDKVLPGPVDSAEGIREAVCIHTRKIYDSCKDKDCIEDLRFYPKLQYVDVINRALSVKGGSAKLLYVYVDVEPVSFNRGFYSVDMRFFYAVTLQAYLSSPAPVTVEGLCVFDKRAILFGSEGNAKVFSSSAANCAPDAQDLPRSTAPVAVVEAVDPLILSMKLVDVCECRARDGGCTEIPVAVAACFPEELMTGGDIHRLFVTLGQFSMIRLERDTQLLVPVYDYCMPSKECPCDSCDCQEDPCDLFRKVQFPVNEFFPPNTIAPRGDSYQEVRANGCCC